MREILRLLRTRDVVDSLEALRPQPVDDAACRRFFEQLGLARSLKLPAPGAQGQGG
jgi:hypothetical protein